MLFHWILTTTQQHQQLFFLSATGDWKVYSVACPAIRFFSMTLLTSFEASSLLTMYVIRLTTTRRTCFSDIDASLGSKKKIKRRRSRERCIRKDNRKDNFTINKLLIAKQTKNEEKRENFDQTKIWNNFSIGLVPSICVCVYPQAASHPAKGGAKRLEWRINSSPAN